LTFEEALRMQRCTGERDEHRPEVNAVFISKFFCTKDSFIYPFVNKYKKVIFLKNFIKKSYLKKTYY
jgi:hypothetical protein